MKKRQRRIKKTRNKEKSSVKCVKKVKKRRPAKVECEEDEDGEEGGRRQGTSGGTMIKHRRRNYQPFHYEDEQHVNERAKILMTSCTIVM